MSEKSEPHAPALIFTAASESGSPPTSVDDILEERDHRRGLRNLAELRKKDPDSFFWPNGPR